MKITAPYGYDEIEPLQKTHRVLLPAGTTPAFCRKLNAIAVSLAEFVVAARDYPIAFVTVDEGRSFAPVAVLGLEPGSNLFVDEAGEWDRTAYFPAFVRRYPFCISKLYVDGEPSSERVVCVARAYVDPAGIELFDREGRGTPAWQAAERLLTEYEADLDRTALFCAALARLRVLEPFTVELHGEKRPPLKLAGMHRVSEAKLKDLKPASHKVLVAKGFMGHVYAHLHSLETFRRLSEREAAQRAARAARQRGSSGMR
ncbi:MAG: SapC family protein [Betaproteobacteria bacterium]|nr:SapC family protein [Betaproteobacteria bacterium]